MLLFQGRSFLFRLVVAVAPLISVVCATEASAVPTPAFTIDNLTGDQLGNPPFTLGWQFTTGAAIDVSALGFFDDSQDGLVDSHPIGIWDAIGNLLASSSVVSGVIDPLTNQFRYTSIVPVLLAPGTYQIGALFATGNDALVGGSGGFQAATNFATAAGIAFNQAAFAAGASLNNPTNLAGTAPGYFGPNFLFSAAAVPEPATIFLLGAGLLGAAAIRRRRKSSAAI